MLIILLKLIFINKNRDLNYKDIDINKVMQGLI